MPDELPDLDGYIEHAPYPCEGVEAEAAEIAQQPQFRCCGEPRQFRPFVKYGRGGRLESYRAFLVCRKCHDALEF